METFLRLNGYKLNKSNRTEIYDFVLQIASAKDISKEEISIFLEKNSQIV